MFNQKVNGYFAENPDYLNQAYTLINPKDTHNCATTINKYIRSSNSSSLPLQTWASTNVAVESFGMRPIVNPKEYFDQLNKFLASIVYTESINLKKSGISNEQYYLFNESSTEPDNSFIQVIKAAVIEKLTFYMSASTDNVGIFKEYNPLCEGFIITDIDITTYRSSQNSNHFLHRILFSAFNSTRYNTVSFRADAYQDTTPMMKDWNNAINLVSNSKEAPKNIKSQSNIYISLITLMNQTTCVTGQESDCEYRGYNLESKFSQLLNENFLKPAKSIFWQQPDSIPQNVYNTDGNYDEDGQIRIIDYGPGNLNELIKKVI